MIKAVIFDYGGVIAWKGEFASTYGVNEQKVVDSCGPLMEEFRTGRMTEEDFWKKLSAFLHEPIRLNKYEFWRAGYEKNFFEDPEMLDFIKTLRAKGIKTALLSNTIVPHLEITKKHNDLKDFDVAIFSCEVGLSKPHPDIYVLTAEKLEMRPEECIFVDDRERNLAPARDIGMKTVLARNPKQVIMDVSAMLDKS